MAYDAIPRSLSIGSSYTEAYPDSSSWAGEATAGRSSRGLLERIRRRANVPHYAAQPTGPRGPRAAGHAAQGIGASCWQQHGRSAMVRGDGAFRDFDEPYVLFANRF
uniref:Uncharacterized protein n=1 Tax=Oryza sativa subsp. japonica TaxID=39947 RepID=Q6ZGP9_ORYSJ|nr:hypothetical protein [Oryza sativa Japonica Group]